MSPMVITREYAMYTFTGTYLLNRFQFCDVILVAESNNRYSCLSISEK
jgi:hypothetical protein